MSKIMRQDPVATTVHQFVCPACEGIDEIETRVQAQSRRSGRSGESPPCGASGLRRPEVAGTFTCAPPPFGCSFRPVLSSVLFDRAAGLRRLRWALRLRRLLHPGPIVGCNPARPLHPHGHLTAAVTELLRSTLHKLSEANRYSEALLQEPACHHSLRP